jgi:hypothetical protein
MVNSKRPQTSYGGISARQKSLQKSLRQKSSKLAYNGESKIEELFPSPRGGDNEIKDIKDIKDFKDLNFKPNYEAGLKNKLSKSKNFI